MTNQEQMLENIMLAQLLAVCNTMLLIDADALLIELQVIKEEQKFAILNWKELKN